MHIDSTSGYFNSKKNTNLVIFGDSWGCGAWTTENGDPIRPSDDYFSECLGKKFNILNFSSGGTSNLQNFMELERFLRNKTADDITKILVIQTEPLRTVLHLSLHGCAREYSHIFKNNSYKQLIETTIDLFYHSLNELGLKYNTIVNLVGGCSDVRTDFIDKYSNINVSCSSFYSLLSDEYIPSVYSTTTDISLALSENNKNNSEVLDLIMHKLYLQEKYEGEFFGWGGDNHPNRKGIELWLEQIYNNIK